MLHENLRSIVTDIAIKWNSGQKMALFMLLVAAEICNYMGWMTYIKFSDSAQQFVNIDIVNTIYPYSFVFLIVTSAAALSFFVYQKNKKFVDRLQLIALIAYSLIDTYISYLIGYENYIAAISICTFSVLIILLCDRKYAYKFVLLNIVVMFLMMYLTNSGIIPHSNLHTSAVDSPFWIYSYLQLCVVKLLLILLLADNMLYGLDESYTKTKFLSEHDALTGLPNRNQVMQFLEGHLAEGKDVGLMMIDLDHFKQVNDNFGHLKGDEVLVKATKTLKRSLRDTDMLGRFGGEEFMLVVPDVDLEIMTIIGMRLHAMMKKLEIPLEENKILKPTASFGVVACDFIRELHGNGLSNEEYKRYLIEMADASMYYAKSHGRNLLVASTDLPPEKLQTHKQKKGQQEIKLTIVDA